MKKENLSTSIHQLQFKFHWRLYQEKVLKNFDCHIDDNHFHIVAPPGSGKTILGIEILKRIGKKTLVLAPTLTIRNQWNERLQDFFTANNDFKSVSFDINSPADITFSTYQSLFAFYKRCESEEVYNSFFVNHNIETLVLDEAHHLKSQWWTSLFQLKEQNLLTVVALTATPPYDSSASELSKYFKLCGEIDDEIVVPDLIKEKNLCPHQDLVFLSEPLDKEINFIVDFRLKIADFVSDLLIDKTFINFIKQHRFYANTEGHLEELYGNTEFFASILIFLKEAGTEISFEKLKLLGFEKNDVIEFPKINNNWIQVLLQNVLVTDRVNLQKGETYLLSLEKKLKRLAIYAKNKVNLVGNELLYKSLSNSPSKLKSITTIVHQEEENLQEDLRCVILTDYIRKEYIEVASSEIEDVKKIGVIPIFLNLKEQVKHKEHLAVLTGSLVIVHQTLLAELKRFDPLNVYIYKPLDTDADFGIINANSSIVETITSLFESGFIKVLIGTKSLLGEGWDAPSINSLILASVVGSFVTSNQMRGRAIRIDANKKDKIAIIWHLACVDFTDENSGRDYEILSNRFSAFLGISNDDKTIITNNLERLKLKKVANSQDLELNNKNTLAVSRERNTIRTKWNTAIKSGNNLSKEIRFFHQEDEPYLKRKRTYFNDTLKFTIGEIIIGISLYIPQYLIRNGLVLMKKGVVYFMYSLLVGLGIAFGYRIYNALQMYFKYGLIHKKVDKIGNTILATLYELDHMITNKEEIYITTELLGKGDVICAIHGANRYESDLFITALNEILAPIDNPKYLIIKTNWLQKKLKIQNFFMVPTVFSAKKKEALCFQKHWNEILGKSKLAFTRSLEGRKLLLKARIFHIHNVTNKITKEALIWK